MSQRSLQPAQWWDLELAGQGWLGMVGELQVGLRDTAEPRGRLGRTGKGAGATGGASGGCQGL